MIRRIALSVALGAIFGGGVVHLVTPARLTAPESVQTVVFPIHALHHPGVTPMTPEWSFHDYPKWSWRPKEA